MGDKAVKFDGVWKKFSRGERHDSLRDLLPAAAKLLFSLKPNVELRDKEFWALRDLSFSVDCGTALGIIGPNGSGKSTALKLLSKILKPDKGSLSVTGRLSTLIELGAGFHPDLTGKENIYLNGTILGMTKAEITSKFDEIVSFAELEDFLDTPVKRYSSGMYARLGFAVAAHVNPDVMVVDEVLSVGDYHFQERCFAKMQQFLRGGTTLIFVSHNLTAVSTLCQNTLVLRYGAPIFCGNTSLAIQKYHSLYEDEPEGGAVELAGVRLTSQDGIETDVFTPGETATLEVQVKARQPIRDAHAGLQIHTADGQCIFVTATSRLTEERLNLSPGQTAKLIFTLDLNVHGNVFLLGFTISPEVETPGEWLYYNPRLRTIVVRDKRKSHGLVYLNPTAKLLFQ
jgi:lipopolysaccharide transport system ATP-binding protein